MEILHYSTLLQKKKSCYVQDSNAEFLPPVLSLTHLVASSSSQLLESCAGYMTQSYEPRQMMSIIAYVCWSQLLDPKALGLVRVFQRPEDSGTKNVNRSDVFGQRHPYFILFGGL
jgi:hypothetical protein